MEMNHSAATQFKKVRRTSVLVIGAGIIGTSVGAELARRGIQVCVIDQGEVGKGCSYGNAGWMTPCFAMPLPMPGMLIKSMKWLLDSQSPLYIKPSLSPDLAFWLFRFLKAMNKNQAQRAIENLVLLSQKSLALYEDLGKKYSEIHFQKKGLLMVSQTSSGVASAVEELNYMQELNVPGKALSAEEIAQMEPALKGSLRGGVYFSQEAMAEPYLVVKAMAQEITQHGGEIFENCEFKNFEINQGQITRVQTSSGIFEADQVVFATGSWSKALAQTLRLRVPILGGKGYSLIVPPLERQPQYPIMFVEKKIAITPRAGSLRIAGTLELVDQDFSITNSRVKNIERGAREILHLPSNLDVKELWAGLRPCTPDGVPLMGRHPQIKNLILAAGHQMLGLQSGAGTGLVIADILENKKTFVDLNIFALDRF